MTSEEKGAWDKKQKRGELKREGKENGHHQIRIARGKKKKRKANPKGLTKGSGWMSERLTQSQIGQQLSYIREGVKKHRNEKMRRRRWKQKGENSFTCEVKLRTSRQTN